MPSWLPNAARHYIAHIEDGITIRQLARDAGCHASTVLRQIRRYETLRDDPLVDAALSRFGRRGRAAPCRENQQEHLVMKPTASTEFLPPITEARLNRDALPVLRHLARPGTVLAVAQDMDKAVVVRDRIDGSPDRLDVVGRDLAEAMALKDWIACKTPGRVSRYTITPTGRTALNLLIARSENAARGFAEGMAGFEMRGAQAVEQAQDDDDETPRGRGFVNDTPVAALARRRDRDGTPFLKPEHVRAGERLREDFELAQMGPQIAQNWDHFLTAGVSSGLGKGRPRGPEAARDRVATALGELGPGLSDIALRCCCHLEGLETAERKMGWSARSAKIVLRIALQRLHRHYGSLPGDSGLLG
ncbi:DUF6456 domain-containing protein [Pseudooceanicola sediminis]|uniref:DUF6456 domain-containing protein n=1 Tax=Pseudooceanicola sediminis TaxID=2211117 RepID=UPI001F3783FA|nr:DUF6456 domain-containing protein [Pseudooceanicola sediminis]